MERINKKAQIRALTVKRIVFAGLLLTLVSLVILFLFRQRISVQLVNNAQVEMLSIVEQHRLKVDVQMKGIFHNMDIIAEDVANRIATGESLDNLQIDRQLVTNKFNHYGLVDIYGKGIIGPDIPLKYFSGIQESLKGERRIVYMSHNPFCENDAVVFSVPVTKQERTMGSVYAIMDMNNLQTVFNEKTHTGQDESFIINAEGTVFVQARDKELAEQIAQIFHDWQQPQASEEMRHLYTKIRQKQSGVERVALLDGRQFYVACVPLNTIDDLYVLNVMPMYLIQNRINEVLNNVTLVTGLLLIFLLLSYGIAEMRQVKYQQKIYHLAYVDTLTGLYNRAKYISDMQTELEKQHSSVCVTLLNIMGMKTINELLGVSFGDKVIYNVAQVLRNHMQSQERVYMGEGGIFYLVSWDSSPEAVKARLLELMEKIEAEDCAQGRQNIQLSAGVYWHYIGNKLGTKENMKAKGISQGICKNALEIDKDWPVNFLTKARVALEQLKSDNKSGVKLFDDRMAEKMRTEKLLKDNFQQALKNNEFTVYYQPKYDVEAHEPVVQGAEALVRWISPQYGFLTPNRFVPLFERDGNVEILDKYVLKQVCRQIRQWLDAGYKVVPISVNISKRNIMGDNNFLKYASEVLAEYAVPNNLLQLEISQTEISADLTVLKKFLQAFKSKGFSLAMDVCGSDYSSLGIFDTMPFDCLKLNKCLFESWRGGTSEKGSLLIKYLIRAAHDAGRSVVAVGVEKEYQLRLLKEYGCDLIQGYYFSKPLPAEDFASKMHKRV